jgi:cyclic-di-GMP-binding protein
MAATASFDITSTVDLQEVDNAVNQAQKEIGQRYDFKGAHIEIDFDKVKSTITLLADDDYKLSAVWEVLQGKMFKRGVPIKNLKLGDKEMAAGSAVRRVVSLQQGIPTDAAKAIVKFLKDEGMKKVQATIQADQVRVTSNSKDELQDAMQRLRGHDFGLELMFGNYRS